MTTFKQFLENEEDQPVRIKLGRRTPSTIQDQFIKNIHDEPVFDKDARSQTHEMNPNVYIFEDEDSEAIVRYELVKGFESNEIIVKEIQTSPTNRGAGKKFMDRLCVEADALNVTLVLNAVPLKTNDRIPATKLIQFYQKFGFKNESGGEKMIRIPNPQS
jgi:GNAT superfamily N-acetyltransferase